MAAVRRRHDAAEPELRAVVALGDVGQRSDRRAAAGLERAEQRPLGGDRRPGARRRRGRPGSRSRSSVDAGRDLDRERALAGRRQHLDRVEHLGDLVGPAEPEQPGPGQHDARRTRPRRPWPAGCRRCRGSATTSTPRPSALSWAARRGEPVPIRAPAGSSPSVSPSRATSTSRGSSRTGTAASTTRGSSTVGRSLSECTTTSTSPATSASRTRADEDARAADLR